jgi:hypothetical protein
MNVNRQIQSSRTELVGVANAKAPDHSSRTLNSTPGCFIARRESLGCVPSHPCPSAAMCPPIVCLPAANRFATDSGHHVIRGLQQSTFLESTCYLPIYGSGGNFIEHSVAIALNHCPTPRAPDGPPGTEGGQTWVAPGQGSATRRTQWSK